MKDPVVPECPVCLGRGWTTVPHIGKSPCTYCDDSDGKDPFLKPTDPAEKGSPDSGSSTK